MKKLRTSFLPKPSEPLPTESSPRRFGIALGSALAVHAALIAGLLIAPSRNAPPAGADHLSPLSVAFTASETLAQNPANANPSPKPEIHPVGPTEQPLETIVETPRIEALLVKADLPAHFEVRFHPGAHSYEPALDLPKPPPVKPEPPAQPASSAPASRATAARTGTPTKPTPRKPAIASTAPRPLRTPAPVYPQSARAKNQQGTIIFTASISSTGRIQSLRRAKSSGYAALDQAAERTVRRWRFAPATQNGVAVAASLRIPIAFRLQ